jgi:hypothetical protein
MLPPEFNAGSFLYLNPELAIASNLTSVRSSLLWAWSNSNLINDYQYDLDGVPKQFDSKLFLMSGNNALNISPLNEIIKNALLLEGFNETDIKLRSQYVETISQNALHVSENWFQFDTLPNGSNIFTVSSNNISINDIVQLRPSNRKLFEYARVVNIDYSSNSIELSNIHPRQYKPIGTQYYVSGLLIYDLERLAQINYLRIKTSNNNEPIITYYQDTTFNPDLYRLLYPSSRELSDKDTYLEYVTLLSNNNRRVTKVSDLTFGSSNFLQGVESLDVNYQLRLVNSTSSFIFKDTTIFGISQDSNITSTDLYPFASTPKLITEYAIKKYVDRNYDEFATFCNIEVKNEATFWGRINMYGPFRIPFTEYDNLNVNSNLFNRGTSVFQSNVTCIQDLYIGSVGYMSNALIQNNFDVYGMSEFWNDVVINSNLTIYKACTVSNITILDSSTTYGSAEHFNNITTHSNLFVYGTGYLCNLSIQEAILNYGTSEFVGDVSLQSNLTVDGNALINNLEISSNLITLGFTTLTDSVTICNDVLIHHNTFSCNVIISNELQTFGSATFYDDMYGHCNMVLFGASTICNNLITHGTTDLVGDVVLRSNCLVQGILQGNKIGIGSYNLISTDNFVKNHFTDIEISNSCVIGSSNTLGSNVATVNGTITAEQYFQLSDRRVKGRITELDTSAALDAVNKLIPCQYTLLNTGKQTVGFIADQIEEVLPDAIIECGSRRIGCLIKAKLTDVYYDYHTRHIAMIEIGYNTGLKKNDILKGEGFVFKVKNQGSDNSLIVEILMNRIEIEVNSFLECNEIIIHDVKAVNYDYMLTHVIGAIHELNKKIKSQ